MIPLTSDSSTEIKSTSSDVPKNIIIKKRVNRVVPLRNVKSLIFGSYIRKREKLKKDERHTLNEDGVKKKESTCDGKDSDEARYRVLIEKRQEILDRRSSNGVSQMHDQSPPQFPSMFSLFMHLIVVFLISYGTPLSKLAIECPRCLLFQLILDFFTHLFVIRNVLLASYRIFNGLGPTLERWSNGSTILAVYWSIALVFVQVSWQLYFMNCNTVMCIGFKVKELFSYSATFATLFLSFVKISFSSIGGHKVK